MNNVRSPSHINIKRSERPNSHSWRDYFRGNEDEPDKATWDVNLYPSAGKEAPNMNSSDQATLSQ